MKRLRRVITLALVALVALVAAPLAHADDDTPSSWRVDRYEQKVVLDPSGTADVTLDLYFDFGRDAGRGPYLWFPTRQRVAGDPDVWRRLDVSVQSVTSTTGASTELKQETKDGHLVVRVGSANRKDRLGIQHYTITYRARGLVEPGASSGLDEFNWNAVGLGWEVPMGSARVEVTGPAGIERVACFQGSSFSRACEATQTASGAVYQAGPLRKGEGVQVVAGFPKGTFVGAEPQYDKRYHPGNLFPVTPGSVGLTGALAGLGFIGLVLARRRGGDRAYVGVAPGLTPAAGQDAKVGRAGQQPVVVQFTPPKGTNPGEVGTLIDASADDLDVSAMLVDLAVRGHLRITDLTKKKKKKWHFDRLQSHDPLTGPERHLLDSLFRTGSSVDSDKIDMKTYMPMFSGTKSQLNQRVTNELGWFGRRPATAQALAIAAGVGLILGGVLLGAIMAFAFGLGLVALAPVAVGIAVIVMSNRFAGRTPQGSAMLAQTRGFELYLKTAEADQIRFEESIDVFSRYLPYAMVFGVADRWAKVFQELAAAGRYEPDTSWYVGPNVYFYSPGFADSLGSLASDLGASFAESAAPSGGSGGGSGFSGGGGFGGGGGGGW